jgi:hypothetical protein
MQGLSRYTLGTLFLLPLALSATPVDEIFVAVNFGGLVQGFVDGYTSTGAAIVQTLTIPNLAVPSVLAVFGNNLLGDGAYGSGIAEFTTGGTLVNPNFISSGALGMTVSGSDVFIDGGTSISEYTTSGALVNASLVSGLSPPGRGFRRVLRYPDPICLSSRAGLL